MWATLTTDDVYTEHEGIPSLEELQAAVGGYVEVVEAVQGITVWLNEEGKLLDARRNDKATFLLRGRIFPHDYIAGDVVFTGGPGRDGETTGLTDAQIKVLRHLDANIEVIRQPLGVDQLQEDGAQ